MMTACAILFILWTTSFFALWHSGFQHLTHFTTALFVIALILTIIRYELYLIRKALEGKE